MNEKDNAQFLRNTVKEEITLPQSLSRENIEKLVSENTGKKRNKGTVRRFVAAGVAACIALSAGAFAFNGGFDFLSPEVSVTKPSENIGISEADDAPYAESVASHESLIAKIRAYAEEYRNDEQFLYGVATDEAVDTDADFATGTGTVNGSSDKGESMGHGETNIRESGVYESDIFITDGEYIYFFKGKGDIGILSTDENGVLSEVSSIEREEKERVYKNYCGLYRYENYLIAEYNCYEIEEDYSYGNESAGIEVYDISEITSPVLVKSFSQDGYFVSSRITDGKLVLISNYYIAGYFGSTDDTLLIPYVYNDGIKESIPAEDIVCINEDKLECYVNISVIDLNDVSQDGKPSSFLGSCSDTYCTADTLYILDTRYTYTVSDSVSFGAMIDTSKTSTDIHSVDISGDTAEYRYNGSVDGAVLNSYSIDEYNGYLRLAVMSDGENRIYVLDEKLQKVGEITGIAPGERIKSARFMGDTAYVVTFVQTDPLFVIDLSEPGAPEIVGEVKLPGFSAYLHPVGDGYLAGIGLGGTDDGVDGSAKISLFDVRDPENPVEADSIVLQNTDISTASKAYMSVSENSFMVPFSKWKVTGDEDYYDYGIYCGALYVSAENGKLILNNAYIARSPEGAVRVTYIGDYVYVFGYATGVASFDMETGEFISTEGSFKENYCYTPANLTIEELFN